MENRDTSEQHVFRGRKHLLSLRCQRQNCFWFVLDPQPNLPAVLGSEPHRGSCAGVVFGFIASVFRVWRVRRFLFGLTRVSACRGGSHRQPFARHFSPEAAGVEVLPVRPICWTRLGIGEDVLGERPRWACFCVAGRGLGNLRGFCGLLGRLCGVDLPVDGWSSGG